MGKRIILLGMVLLLAGCPTIPLGMYQGTDGAVCLSEIYIEGGGGKRNFDGTAYESRYDSERLTGSTTGGEFRAGLTFDALGLRCKRALVDRGAQ